VGKKNTEMMKDTETPRQLEGVVRMKKKNERQRDAEATRGRREDERRREVEAAKRRSEDEEYRDPEARRMERQSDEVRERERTLEYERRNHVLVKKYHTALKCEPTFCCVSCENLF
jgi:hypothetical protein